MRISQEIISQRRVERYEEYRLFEEKTDIGERLSLPIENHLALEVIGDAVYGRDIAGGHRRMTEWAREAHESALNDPTFSGANSVERMRRKHEYDEAVAVERLAVGEAMVVFSPIPDAALAGELSLQGYRTDLARTFCRLYLRESDTVAAVTVSLEQSNKQALAYTAEQLGVAMPASMGSEEVLAARHTIRLSKQEFTELPDLIRAWYDLSLYEQTGTTYFAGNRLAGRQDSMRFINDNHDIIDEHMAFLNMVESRLTPGSFRDSELEKLRQRTAAALDERLHGGIVGSIGDASVSDRMATSEYGGECVTGPQSAQEQMGLAQGKHTTNCPLCGTQGVTATVEGETITCSDCAGSVDICTGKVTHGKPKKAPITSPPLLRKTVEEPKVTRSKEAELSARYGEKIILKTINTIGGADEVAVNVHGDVIAKV